MNKITKIQAIKIANQLKSDLEQIYSEISFSVTMPKEMKNDWLTPNSWKNGPLLEMWDNSSNFTCGWTILSETQKVRLYQK